MSALGAKSSNLAARVGEENLCVLDALDLDLALIARSEVRQRRDALELVLARHGSAGSGAEGVVVVVVMTTTKCKKLRSVRRNSGVRGLCCSAAADVAERSALKSRCVVCRCGDATSPRLQEVSPCCRGGIHEKAGTRHKVGGGGRWAVDVGASRRGGGGGGGGGGSGRGGVHEQEDKGQGQGLCWAGDPPGMCVYISRYLGNYPHVKVRSGRERLLQVVIDMGLTQRGWLQMMGSQLQSGWGISSEGHVCTRTRSKHDIGIGKSMMMI